VGAVLLVPGEGSLILSTAGKERRVGALDGGWSPMALANLTNRKKNDLNTHISHFCLLFKIFYYPN
jgi:hypothetical protein